MHSFTRIRRRALAVLAVLALTLASLVVLVSPASAGSYAGAGAIGPYAVPQIDCRHKIWGTTGVLQMTAPPPTVYAYNYRAGAGNDGAYIRYAVYLANVRTGATMQASSWSGWAWAADNRPAAFSGAAMYSPDWRGQYVVDYRIEWWAAGGRAPLAWTAHRADRYFYVASNTVAGGVWQTCMKMY